MDTHLIQTAGLSKRFGTQQAVDALSLTIDKGEIYGFLGPNGAGKTTTLRMILGLTKPDSGEIYYHGNLVNGTDPSYRANIGVVPEKHPSGMWKWMTAVEYLQLFGNLFDVTASTQKINSMLDHLDLRAHKNKPICKFSRGMMQKLSFARALIHDPEILLLDEPISGLDPFGIHQMRDLIIEQHRKGKTIIVSSHLLSEVEKFCTRIGIIHQGKMITENATNKIIDSIIPTKNFRIEIDSISDGLIGKFLELPFILDAKIDASAIVVSVEKEGDYRKAISSFLYDNGISPLLIQEQVKTLEEAFLSITSIQANTHEEAK
ncbi:ABC transporter ATP-binding protein [Pleomorphochaeta sp. DL1XJH-081]|uniref:ABC transporter ATP-binding protein n=1 Tax=Pleomorphochaeta sp. DL1XJH-081 TaxID=3409690 RepID=UPI003BB60F9C